MEFVGTTETFSFNELEVKGVKEYFISGYISTKSIDKFNDLITDECLEDMTNQINNNSIKIDYEHETIHSNNLSINPIARIVEAKKDDKGVWVKAVMNPSNNKFNEVWSSIKQGFLDSFSIAFKPIEAVTRYISGKAIRVLNKLKLINVGITGTPVNDDCKLDNVIVKALDTIEYLPLDDLSDEELELKHKYIKRTGSTGNYKYFYREDEQRDSKRELFKEIAENKLGKQPEKKSLSHSTEQSEDNNTMANEEKPKDEKLNEDEVDTKNEDAELEDASEDKSDKIEEKSDDEDEDDEEKSKVEELSAEVKSLKSQLAELKEKLSEPEFKALQQPITKLKENVTTPLSLIG